MKVMASIALMLVVCLAVFLTGRSDKSAELLAESQTNVAAANPLVQVTSRTGNAPEVVEYVKPVIWDGVSEIQQDVMYRFSCEDEMLAAFSSIPGFIEQYQQAKAMPAKSKAGRYARLATGEWGNAVVNTDGSDIWARAVVETGSSSESYTIIAQASNGGSVGKTGTLSPYSSESVRDEGPCPYYGAIAHAWIGYVSEHDGGDCN